MTVGGILEAMPKERLLKVDSVPLLASSGNVAISFFARRDLLDLETDPVSTLWRLPEAQRIVRAQQPDGSWRYPGGKPHVRSQENYDQLETFRQAGTLVEKFGFTCEHPAIERAADFLFSFQTAEGDFRGIYGNQYATTYVGAIIEVLVKAGYARDPRIASAFRWLLTMRQSDGGWAIPVRTVGVPFSEFTNVRRYPEPIPPDSVQTVVPSGDWHGAESLRRPFGPAQVRPGPQSGRVPCGKALPEGLLRRQRRRQLLGAGVVPVLVHGRRIGPRLPVASWIWARDPDDQRGSDSTTRSPTC